MAKKEFNPNFKTPPDQLCKEELNKLNSNGMRGHLFAELRNELPDLTWESEQLAKSCGIYLEFDRAKTGEEKDWMYMIRISVPGGGPLTRRQWQILDDLSEKYTRDPQGSSSVRFTTRQNIQLHWVKKSGLIEIIKSIAHSGYSSINGCGDNTRNVMGCPLSQFSGIFNALAWAQKAGAYFCLPLDPYIEIFSLDPQYIRKPGESFQYGPNLLNRKFKIAFSCAHRDPQTGQIHLDNCVEHRTNDLSVVPVMVNGSVKKFQVYVGGGQGERNGKPTMATLGLPLCQCSQEELLPVLDAVVAVHQEWGDRQNRFWARVKYVVKKMGIEWYRDRVSARLGFPLEKPEPHYDSGPRMLHHGWTYQESNGLWAFGLYLENGRITDGSPNGKIKTMIRSLMEKFPVEMYITSNQDALFVNIPEQLKGDFTAEIEKFRYGLRQGKPFSRLRLNSGACVGRDTCRLTYTDSEKLEPELLDQLEAMGWGPMNESIGITGCERQCFRPATKTIGLVGSGLDRYQLKLGGSESAAHQGRPLLSRDGTQMYLRSIPREKLAIVIDALFRYYRNFANPGEDMGAFHRRIGSDAIITYLKQDPATCELMAKSFPTDTVLD